MGGAQSAGSAGWFEHGYFRTYKLADHVERMLARPDYHFLEAFTLDNAILDLVAPWQAESALHKFIRYMADEVFEADTGGDNRKPNLMTLPQASDCASGVLPIDAVMYHYGIDRNPFLLPASVGQDPGAITNAYYDYIVDLRWTAVYDTVMKRLAEEVFFIMFLNRSALLNLNLYLAGYVQEVSLNMGTEDTSEEDGITDLHKLFKRDGVLRRKGPPEWARRAVFFRDRGCCVACHRDLTGLLNLLSKKNFDHMVPLAQGGLNDITNLQLLCDGCNLKKSDKLIGTSHQYQLWYG